MDEKAYLKILPLIFKQDEKCLLEKESTYGSSWKASGGRSSWFMVVRKIDRLLKIMKRPETPPNFNMLKPEIKDLDFLFSLATSEDIFEKIKVEEAASGGKGLDGSCLDQLRDLRRYAALIESECVARGYLGTDKIPVFDTKDDENNHDKYDGVL